MSKTELDDFVTAEKVEWAYGMAMQSLEHRRQHMARVGMRAAKARDERLLKVLEKGTEILHRMSEHQMGETRRQASTPYSHQVEQTEVALWRKAYEFCDAGNPLEELQWIYGAAALICGYAN